MIVELIAASILTFAGHAVQDITLIGTESVVGITEKLRRPKSRPLAKRATTSRNMAMKRSSTSKKEASKSSKETKANDQTTAAAAPAATSAPSSGPGLLGTVAAVAAGSYIGNTLANSGSHDAEPVEAHDAAPEAVEAKNELAIQSVGAEKPAKAS
jgi:anti-sigma factor RsiW